jgi:hypothetical protein
MVIHLGAGLAIHKNTQNDGDLHRYPVATYDPNLIYENYHIMGHCRNPALIGVARRGKTLFTSLNPLITYNYFLATVENELKGLK